MKVLITGATGFLGNALVGEFLKYSHIQVIGIGRNEEKMKDVPIQWYKGDLNNEFFLKEVFNTTYDYVIHCAALSKNYGPISDFINSNVKSTENLVNILKLETSTKFIYISTPSIFAKNKNQYNISENELIDLEYIKKSNYIYTKYLAENIVKTSSVNALIIRPRAILGARDQSIWPNLMKANKKIGIPLFRDGSLLLSYTNVHNLSSFISSIILKDTFVPKIINICDGYIKMKEAINIFKKHSTFPIKEAKLSYRFLIAISNILSLITSKRKEPIINKESLSLLYYDMTFDTSNASSLGYIPLNDFECVAKDILNNWNQGEMKWEK